MIPRSSDLTSTDLFCGAGGSSIGLDSAGVTVRNALNHWQRAIDTHAHNFPDANHDCTDISATNPRRYPRTNILWGSPECTNHSLAKGAKRKGLSQYDAFTPITDDPAAERSRATMWDVPRFAEYHNYDAIIVENVVEARHWVGWNGWLRAMHDMGYDHKAVYLNSMFAHPTPQSRDRMYVVFWKRGNRAPDLEIRPPAFCVSCDKPVEAVQSWKRPDRQWGRYRQQYVYRCPTCAAEVTPYYYAALNAIDWTIPAERIGDRKRPLQPRTLGRVSYGYERYGRRPLIITGRYTSGVECRVRDATAEAMPTQPGHISHAVLYPPAFLVDTLHASGTSYRTRGLTDPGPTQTGRSSYALVLNGAALMVMRASDKAEQLVRELTDPLFTQATMTQQALIQSTPFLVSYYGQDQASSIDSVMGTLSTRDRHALLQPPAQEATDINVNDLYFRMLKVPEIGRGMAFHPGYIVVGNSTEQVKQYGNAVTPPAAELIGARVVASLEAA